MIDIDSERRDYSATRRRMLEGTWAEDLKDFLLTVLNVTRAENMGRLSTAVNLAKSVCEQVGPVLYASEPAVLHDDEAVAEDFVGLLDRMHMWQMSQRHGTMTYGLRECAWKLDWSPDANEPRLRLVTPDVLKIEADPDDADRLWVVRHLRRRIDPLTGKDAAFWDVYDLRAGTLTIEDMAGEPRPDLTPEGEYPRDAAGPIPLWTLYHAAPTGTVWDPWCLSELFDAAFDVGVLWNSFHHVMRDASWAQKYAINLELASNAKVSEGAASVVTSPTSLLRFRSSTDGQGELGVLEAPVDVEKFAAAVLQYQRTAVATLGLHPTDIEQTAAESGVAIAIKRSAQRRMAEALEPQRRAGDVATLNAIARLSNALGGTRYPVDGWRIEYALPADSVTERDAELEYHRKLVDAGLMSRSEWLRRIVPTLSEEDALRRIIDVEMERRYLEAQVAAAVASVGTRPEPDDDESEEEPEGLEDT